MTPQVVRLATPPFHEDSGSAPLLLLNHMCNQQAVLPWLLYYPKTNAVNITTTIIIFNFWLWIKEKIFHI